MGFEKTSWKISDPASFLPLHIWDKVKVEAIAMYRDLKINKLEVALDDALEPMFEGHKVRNAVEHNPQWYSQDIYPLKANNGRVRQNTVKALLRLVEGLDKCFTIHAYAYDAMLRGYILSRLAYGYNYCGCKMIGNTRIRLFIEYNNINLDNY